MVDRMARSRGSIKLVRTGVYRIRVDAGVDSLTGKRSQPSRTVVGSRRDAQEALNKWLVDIGAEGTRPQEISVEELFERWITAPTRGGRVRKPSTVYRERSRYRTRIHPALGGRQAHSLTAGEITRWYDSLLREAGLSSTSVHRIHETLNAMYSFAVRREILRDNPFKRVAPPSVILIDPWAPEMADLGEHLRRLRDANPNVWLALRMSATMGLRRSDVLALRWRHIDLDTGAVEIRDGATWIPGEGLVISSTKTGELGSAILMMDPDLLAAIRKKHADVLVHASKAEVVADDLFVFASNGFDSDPMHADSLTKAVQRHCARNQDLPPFTPHDLRSFASTELEANGSDISTAQAVMRHRSPMTTLRHYRVARDRRIRQATRDLGVQLAKF